MTKITAKLDLINKKLNQVEKIEEHLEELVDKEDKEVSKIEQEEKKIEKSVLRVGKFNIKRSHLLELARGTAGAFLGVGLGQALANSVVLAEHLPWLNIIGILVFILIIVGILIYKNDRDQIDKRSHHTLFFIIQRLTTLYIISLVVQLLGLILFNNFPGVNETLYKALIIGSYSAMSSAVAFTLI